MDRSEIPENYPALRAAANDLPGLFGPEFTNAPQGYVETGIAAAASLAGLSILRGKGFDLHQFTPGSMIFVDLETEMDGIWDFLITAAGSLGLNPSGGWDLEIPADHQPVLSIPEMTQKTEKEFLAICARHNLQKDLFPHVAVPAALKLVSAADTMNLLDQSIGKALTGFHIVAGAKTVPYP